MRSKNSSESKFHFAGFQRPNYTQVPDELFDELLAELSDGELRVLLYIIRRTFGFKKDYDDISLRQMVEGIRTRDGRVLDRGAGLSKASAARAVAGLSAKGIISATRNSSPQKGNEPTTYALRFRSEFLPMPEKGPPLSKTETRLVSLERHPLVSPADPQDTVRQDTVEQETVSSKDKSSDLGERTALRFSKKKVSKYRNQGGLADNPVGDPDLSPSRGTAPAGLTPVGELISLRRAQALAQVDQAQPAKQGSGTKRRGNAPPATPWIEQLMTDFSSELHDEEHTRQNISQAARLWQESGREEAAFVQLLYEARSLTKQYRVKKKATGEAGEYGLRNKMPYYFSVLKDQLGLKEPRTDPAPGRPAAPPG